jgi:hypothetical protein
MQSQVRYHAFGGMNNAFALQNVGEAVKSDLKGMLLEGSAAFRAFARPQENNGDVDFVLTEAVIIAAK